MTHAGLGHPSSQAGWPVETAGGTVLVSKLRESDLHKLCIDLYQRHRPSGFGLCLEGWSLGRGVRGRRQLRTVMRDGDIWRDGSDRERPRRVR